MKMKKKLFALILAMIMLFGMFPITSSASNIRESYPNSSESTWHCYSSSNIYKINPSTLGNCTWYAYGRALEKCGVKLGSWGDAGFWYGKAKAAGFSVGTEPREDSIICWGDAYGNGHVAFVEMVEGASVTWTESNYYGPKFKKYTSTHPWTYAGKPFQGYIYLNPPCTHSYTKDNPYVCSKCDDWKTDSQKSTKSLSNIQYIITSNDAKDHTGPYGDCKTVNKYSKNTIVIAVQEIINGYGKTWYKLSNGNYIYSDYVKKMPAPKWATIKANRTEMTVGETINFEFNSDTADCYTIGIDRNNERILTKGLGNNKSFSYTCAQAGEYSAYISASNSAGGIDSSRVSWTVKDVKSFTIKFDANGGTGAPASITKTQGVDINIPADVPSRFGYTFVGWSPYSTADSAKFIPGAVFNKNANVTLYAVWSEAKEFSEMLGQATRELDFPYAGKCRYYKITPKYDGPYHFESSGELDSKVSVYDSSGQLLDEDDNSGKNNNYALRMNLKANNTYFIKVESKNAGTMKYAFVRLFVVKYDANGGTNAPKTQYKYFKKDLTLRSEIPTREGYEFLGWALDKDATSAVYLPADTFTVDNNRKLYAVWEKKECSHNWQWLVSTEATCTQDGEKYLQCSLCSATQNSVDIPASGHNFGEWIVTSTPTISDIGVEERFCSYCNEKETHDLGFSDILGDVVYDGQLTIDDAQAVLESTEYGSNLDVNIDGIVTAADSREILRKIYDCSENNDNPYSSGSSEYMHFSTYVINNVLYLTVSVSNLKGVESGDISLIYDNTALEFVDCISLCNSDISAVKELSENEIGFSFAYIDYSEEYTNICQYSFNILSEKTVQFESRVYSWNGIGAPYTFGSSVYFDEPETDHEHNFTDMVTEPTCGNDGNTMYMCGCGYYYVDTLIPATRNHQDYNNDYVCDVCSLMIPSAENIQILPDIIPDEIPDDVLYGDVNDDGVIDGLDATRLLQFLAEWDVEINIETSDVNADGVVDGLDATRLLQYLAEWDVVLGSNT